MGERIFSITTAAILILLFLFYLGILLSIVINIQAIDLVKILQTGEVFYAVKLSLFTATISTLLALGIATPAAYTLSRTQFPGKAFVDTLINIPIVLSPVALGAALLLFFSNPMGNFIEQMFLQFAFGIPGVVLAQFTVVTALAVRILKTTFDSIPPRYEIAARVLGSTKREAVFMITLPLAKQGFIAATLLTWARAVGEYGATITLAGATKMKTETLPAAIYLNLASADVEEAFVLILILVIIAIISLFLIKMLGGIKMGLTPSFDQRIKK